MKHKVARVRSRLDELLLRSIIVQQLSTQVLALSDCTIANGNKHPETSHLYTSSISNVIAAELKGEKTGDRGGER